MIIVWKIVLVIQTMGQSKCVISESSGPARYTCVVMPGRVLTA